MIFHKRLIKERSKFHNLINSKVEDLTILSWLSLVGSSLQKKKLPIYGLDFSLWSTSVGILVKINMY